MLIKIVDVSTKSNYFKVASDFMNGDNININWTLQIILFLFIFVGGLILGNLITGLTVNRIEQLFEKAEMYFNVKASIVVATGLGRSNPHEIT